MPALFERKVAAVVIPALFERKVAAASNPRVLLGVVVTVLRDEPGRLGVRSPNGEWSTYREDELVDFNEQAVTIYYYERATRRP